MTTEAETNPEAGVDAQGQTAPNDDIDTEAFDRMEAPADEDDDSQTDASGEGKAGDDASETDKAKDDDGSAEVIEYEAEDGAKYKVPAALKDHLLRHADYTRKTQEVADVRRQHTEQVQAWEAEKAQQTESLKALQADYGRVSALEAAAQGANQRLDQVVDRTGLKLRDVNWPAFRAQAQADPDMADHYKALWAEYEAANQDLAHYNNQLGAAKTELQTKEAKRLEDAAKTAEAALAKRREETVRVLTAAIPGWNNQLAKEAIELGVKDYGLTLEEVSEMTDPRTWRVLHDLKVAMAEIARLKSTQKQQETANNNSKAAAVTPAATSKGGGGANARDPSTGRGDGLSMEEWMRRRTAQLAKKRA